MKGDCIGCIYWRTISFAGLMACHWALDNPPHCRLAPAVDCTFKLTKLEVIQMSKRFSDDDARRLYEEGKSDSAIAAIFGVNANSVLYWRKTHGLPANIQISKCKKKESGDKPMPETQPVTELKITPELNEYDPLIYDVFDLAIAKTYERGGQPSLVWRKLLQASEFEIMRLHDYLLMSEEACRCAVELAALAVLDEQSDEN